MTDERMDQCKLCSHIRLNHIVACIDCDLQDQDPRYHSFEEAPSTDEGEARVNAPDKRGHFWFRQGTNMLGHSVWRKGPGNMVGPWWGTVAIPPEVEATIRAPLEERIRERDYTVNLLEAEARQFRTIIGRERAEVERLREAIIWMSGSSEFGPGQPAHEHWVEIRDTLLFPPSSTEGTSE